MIQWICKFLFSGLYTVERASQRKPPSAALARASLSIISTHFTVKKSIEKEDHHEKSIATSSSSAILDCSHPASNSFTRPIWISSPNTVIFTASCDQDLPIRFQQFCLTRDNRTHGATSPKKVEVDVTPCWRAHLFKWPISLVLQIHLFQRPIIYYRNLFIIFSLHTEMDENRCTNGIIRVATKK